jgi:hypothetical protein
VIEDRGMIAWANNTAIRIDQDVFGADPHFLQQATEQGGLVLTIAVASMKNVARGMRLVSADADLDRQRTSVCRKDANARALPSKSAFPAVSSRAFCEMSGEGLRRPAVSSVYQRPSVSHDSALPLRWFEPVPGPKPGPKYDSSICPDIERNAGILGSRLTGGTSRTVHCKPPSGDGPG